MKTMKVRYKVQGRLWCDNDYRFKEFDENGSLINEGSESFNARDFRRYYIKERDERFSTPEYKFLADIYLEPGVAPEKAAKAMFGDRKVMILSVRND